MQRAHEVLYYVGLGEARYRNVETYSTGMKQRIKLAQALVHDPDLLFLDEPTNGMDPKGREEMLELIRDLAHNKGINLILSSHLLPDVEYTCDHVVVLDKGTVATFGPIDQLKGPAGACLRGPGQGRSAGRSSRALHAAGLETARRPTRTSCASSCRVGGAGRRRRIQRRSAGLRSRPSVQVRHLKPSLPSLEDVFARAVGEAMSPIHDQSYRRYQGTRQPPGRAWTVIARDRHPEHARAQGLPRRCCSSPGFRSSSAPCRSTSSTAYPAGRPGARRVDRRCSRSSSSSRALFVFFVTVYVGAGLIADRPPRQRAADLPVEAADADRVHRRQARDPRVVPAVHHAAAGAAAGHHAGRCSPAASTFLRSNLVPRCRPIVLASLVRVIVASFTMLALSSLSKSTRYVAILYAGIDLLHRSDLRRAARRSPARRASPGCRSAATSTIVTDVMFRQTPRYETPVVVSVLVLLGLVVAVDLGARASRARRGGGRVSDADPRAPSTSRSGTARSSA